MATAGPSVNVGGVETGEYVANLKDALFPIAFSPDSRTLATAGPNNTVLLWDVQGH
jgi:WD40 repeat protein